MLPIIGAIDPHRAENMMEGLLTRLVATRARSVILDVTGVDALDAAAADHLLGVTRAASLLGARCVLTGCAPRSPTRWPGSASGSVTCEHSATWAPGSGIACRSRPTARAADSECITRLIFGDRIEAADAWRRAADIAVAP
ncbi:STAS domain-containing protein [Nannocystis pusilla]|uniref:STAS domain-containing protein n=1 Tax=Nannocystis pusilla TaxID=889268 RepID=UPI003B7FF52C